MRTSIIFMMIFAISCFYIVVPAYAGEVKAQKLTITEINKIKNTEAGSSNIVCSIKCGDNGDVALGVLACLAILLLVAAAASSSSSS